MAKEKKHLFSRDIPNRVFDLWGCHKRKNLPRNYIIEGINLMVNSVNREVNEDGKRIIFKPTKDEDVMFTYKALTVGSDLSFILRGDPGCHAWDMTKNKVKPLKD